MNSLELDLSRIHLDKLILSKEQTPEHFSRPAAWWIINLGEDVGLPNICDRNCAGCCDDNVAQNLKEVFPDNRQKLFKELGVNWFPSNWSFKEEWKFQIINHFQTYPPDILKIFWFTGRGDPLFYMPVINSFMKTYKELDYLNENSWSVISTSASMLTPTKIDALCNLGINEINFNLAATDFSKTTLDKMKLAKKKLKVSVEVPLLTAYEKNLIDSLPILEDIGISYLTLSVTRAYSASGVKKLLPVMDSSETFTEVMPNKLKIIRNDAMIFRILEELKVKNYPYHVTVVED